MFGQLAGLLRPKSAGHRREEAIIPAAGLPSASVPIFVHVHVPKCGGTSINVLLERWFREGFERWYSGLPDHARSITEMETFVAGRPGLRCLSSHDIREFPPALNGRPVFYFTFLREPVDRLVSCAQHLLRERAELSPKHDRYLPDENAAPDVSSVLRGWISTAGGSNRKTHVEASSLARFFFQSSWATLESLDPARPKLNELHEEADDRMAFALAVAELRRFLFVGDFAQFQGDVQRFGATLRRFGVSAEVGPLPHERRSSKGVFRSELEEAEIRRELRAVLPIDVALYESLPAWSSR